MWQIPTQTRFGCGYVYSDQFRTPDEAHAEVERVLADNRISGAPVVDEKGAIIGVVSQLLMGTICLFMAIWGTKLCMSTWNQFMSALPTLRVGITYMPIPVGGVLTLIFVLEKLLLGDQSNRKVVRFDLVEESEGAA